MSSKSRNPLLTFLLSYHVWVTSKIQVNFRFERYWWYCLINCWNFQTIHVFEVRESIADISTELPCLSYLENLGQLPVQGYLKGTDNCILWIFTISSLFMFSRSRNPLLTFLLSYDVWVTSIIQVNFRFERYWWFCLMNFWNFHTIRVFEVRESIADISTELPCLGNLKIQVNFRFKTYSEVLVNVSYRFLKFLDYPCFWGQRIHCWYFYRATMFGWPRKSRLTSGPTRTRRYWWLCLVDFWNFFTIYVFEVSESFDDIPTELLCLGDLKNSGHLLVQEVFEVTQTFVPWQKSSKFISSRAKVAGRSHDQRFIVNFIVMSRNVMSCHVMPRHVASCYVMPRQVTSCYVMSRNFTSCHVMPRHVTSCHVMYLMSRHATSCHVTSCHVT